MMRMISAMTTTMKRRKEAMKIEDVLDLDPGHAPVPVLVPVHARARHARQDQLSRRYVQCDEGIKFVRFSVLNIYYV